MKKLIFFLLLTPILSSAQKSYYSIDAAVDWPKNVELGYGIRLHGGAVIEDNVFLGVGAGVTKLDEVKGVYVPLFFNISFAYNAKNKLFPILVLQPGYGIYKHTTTILNQDITTNGGFTFYGGAGFGYSGEETKTHITFGYSRYGFKTGKAGSYMDGMALRLSFMGL